MYDNLHLHFTLPNPGTTAEQALAQAPAFAGATGEPDARGRIRHTYRGLRLEYRPGQYKGRVRGSLHTFAQGNNLGTFTAADVARAVAELAEALALPPEALLVKWLEVGVNLTVPISPRPFLEQLYHHRQSPFYPLAPPPGIARPLEYVAYHAAYRLKYYDKGAYAALQGFIVPPGHHLLRFEIVYTRARNLCTLTGLPVLTLADLTKPDILRVLGAELLKHWHLTTRRQSLDYATLKFSDAALLLAGASLEFWAATRAITPPATYHRNRARYNQLQREAARRALPHPYDALLPTILDQMLTNANILKSDRLCHTCNQLD